MNETIQQDYKHNYIIEQLQKHGCTDDIEGKSYKELQMKLIEIRAKNVDITADANRWF